MVRSVQLFDRLQGLFSNSPRPTRSTLSLKPYVQHSVSIRARFLPRFAAGVFLLLCAIYGFLFAIFAPYLIVPFAFPVAFLGIIAIWALPDTGKPPTRALEIFLFASLIGLVVWPRYLALALPGLPWITVTRLAGFPLTVALLLCVSTSQEFRHRITSTLNVAPLAWKLLCVLLVVQVLTIPLSSHPMSTLNRFINVQITCIAVFFASCYVFTRPSLPTRAAAAIWLLAITVGLVGLIEYRASQVPWSGHIPGFLKVEDESVIRILGGTTRSYAGNYRVQGTFTTSLAFAEYLGYALPFILHFAIGNYRLVIRTAAAASVPLVLFVVLTTDSRLGLVASFLSFLAYVLFTALLRWRRRRESLIAPAIVLAYPLLFTLAVTAVFAIGRIRTKLWGGQYQSSNDGRMEQVADGIPKILHNPLGYGMGEAAEVLGWARPDGLLTIDSYWLAAALDFGIVGFLAFFGFFIAVMVLTGRGAVASSYAHTADSEGRQTESALLVPITITLINFIVIKMVFADESNHMLPFMLSGMALALIWRTRTENFIDSTKSEPRNRYD